MHGNLSPGEKLQFCIAFSASVHMSLSALCFLSWHTLLLTTNTNQKTYIPKKRTRLQKQTKRNDLSQKTEIKTHKKTKQTGISYENTLFFFFKILLCCKFVPTLPTPCQSWREIWQDRTITSRLINAEPSVKMAVCTVFCPTYCL